eukprot:TRINITY_DN10668_c0_g1_i1.p1 TRINITY_DN10668_c0_g1~~TRINITY_DN10668_c0_g1_i1.p1  ORF type:complete len:901 (+),score=170.83 TRINITY_DN10668_c0_g1_i1:283-2985(+)
MVATKQKWSMREWALMLFGLDKRSLALFRVYIAATVLGDLVNRSTDLTAHYTDWGAFPRWIALEHYQNIYWAPLHFMNGTFTFMVFMFLLHGFIVVLMMIGYKTRLMTFLTWFFTLSLNARNLLVGHGGDVYLRVVLFFAMFLPLGDMFSVDAVLRTPSDGEEKRKKKSVDKDPLLRYQFLSGGTICFVAQVAIVYSLSFFHKTDPVWTTDGTAIFYALNLEFFTKPLGRVMLLFPAWFLKYFTISVLYWEGIGPLFWYSPVFNGACRFLASAGFWGMHFGFFITMRLGMFPFVGMAAALTMMPPLFWDSMIVPLHKAIRGRAVSKYDVYIDATTGRGRRLTRFVDTFISVGDEKVQSIDYLPSKHQSARTTGSGFVVIDNYDRRYTKSDALYALLAATGWLQPVAIFLLFTPVVAFVDKIWFVPLEMAIKRKSADEHDLDDHEEEEMLKQRLARLKARRSSSVKFTRKYAKQINIAKWAFFSATLVYVLMWNFNQLDIPEYGVGERFMWFGFLTQLDQGWKMFSPKPPPVQFWYSMEAILGDNSTGELWRNDGMFTWELTKPFKFEKLPVDKFHTPFKNHRWFKFYENLNMASDGSNNMRLSYGRYICREYNDRHFNDSRIQNFRIWVHEDFIELNGTRVNQTNNVIWEHTCYYPHLEEEAKNRGDCPRGPDGKALPPRDKDGNELPEYMWPPIGPDGCPMNTTRNWEGRVPKGNCTRGKDGLPLIPKGPDGKPLPRELLPPLGPDGCPLEDWKGENDTRCGFGPDGRPLPPMDKNGKLLPPHMWPPVDNVTGCPVKNWTIPEQGDCERGPDGMPLPPKDDQGRVLPEHLWPPVGADGCPVTDWIPPHLRPVAEGDCPRGDDGKALPPLDKDGRLLPHNMWPPIDPETGCPVKDWTPPA